jgi:hypothetical protein
MRGAQVRLETQTRFEIVRANLHTRLADLEGGLGHRVLPFFYHQDAQGRRFLMQLPRQASTGQATAEDDDIEGVVRVQVAHRASF